jgi:hypothetical protein
VRTGIKDWTGIEIEAARRGLEQASAVILGRMLFEFSRLDLALGLFLVWSGEGRQLEKLTKVVGEYSFHKKLDFLKELADRKYSRNTQVQSNYGQWLADARATRLVRNELVHGRWGTDPIKGQVINVVGLPTSSDQREKRYTISELRDALNQIKKLQIRLQLLRDQWPV